jgi:hypothetical protein
VHWPFIFSNSHSIPTCLSLSQTWSTLYDFHISDVTQIFRILNVNNPYQILITSHIITINLILVPNIW